jgi:hypothetical protein
MIAKIKIEISSLKITLQKLYKLNFRRKVSWKMLICQIYKMSIIKFFIVKIYNLTLTLRKYKAHPGFIFGHQTKTLRGALSGDAFIILMVRKKKMT